MQPRGFQPAAGMSGLLVFGRAVFGTTAGPQIASGSKHYGQSMTTVNGMAAMLTGGDINSQRPS